MDNNTQIVQMLRDKVGQLISLYEHELESNSQLEAKCRSMEVSLAEQDKKINELEGKIKKLQLAGAFKSTSKDSQAAKAKIGRIVREIDKCIALLNR